MRLFLFIFVAGVALCSSAHGQIAVVSTLTNLLARPVSPNPRAPLSADVLGFSEVGDWGGRRRWDWDPTNNLATNAIWNGKVLRASTYSTNTVGRWVHQWDGHPGVFGVRFDGTDSSVAFQDMVDAQARARNTPGTNSSATFFDGGGLIGPPIRLPAARTIRAQGIRPRYGTTILGDGPPADRDYPRDQTAARILAPAGSSQSVFRLGEYVLDGVTNTARFVTLLNFIIDGAYDSQNPDHLWLSGIEIDGVNVKNCYFGGLSIYDTVGWGILARSISLGASTLEGYYGSAALGGATDLQVINCRFTGRTQGGSAKTPYPPLWVDRFGGKNQFVNLFLFGGPRRESGSNNSIRTWSITGYPTTSSITLASTNGLYTGLPVMWSSQSTHSNLTTLGQDNTYYVLFGGSNTVQLVSTTFWADRTPVTFTVGPITNDVLVLGSTNAPLMLLSGLDNSGLSTFTGLRLEDNDGDLLELVGSSANTFLGIHANFTYTNTSRFLRLRNGADNNRFVGGIIGRRPDGLPWAAPITNVEIDENSEGNSFSSVHIAYATGANVINRATNNPPNRFDATGTQFFPMAGSAPGIRFEDRDVTGGFVTNLLIYNNRSLYFVDDTENDYSNHADWWWDGINNTWHAVGDGATVGSTFSGYAATPVFTLRTGLGTRASPSATSSNLLLGGLFWTGRDSNDWASARAGITARANDSWVPASQPASLSFWTTPTNSTTRRESLVLGSDGQASFIDRSTPAITLRTTSGIPGAETHPADESVLGRVQFTGTSTNATGGTTNAFAPSVVLEAAATDQWATNSTPGRLKLRNTPPSSTTLQDVVTWDNDGSTYQEHSGTPRYVLQSRKGLAGAETFPVNGTVLGEVAFGGFNVTAGTFMGPASSIRGIAQGTWTANSAPSRLAFRVTPSGSTNQTEVMGIEQDGTWTWTDDNTTLTIVGNTANGFRVNLPSGHSSGAYLSIQVNFVNVFRADGTTNTTNSGLNIMTPWGFKRFAFTNINGAAVAYIPGVTPP